MKDPQCVLPEMLRCTCLTESLERQSTNYSFSAEESMCLEIHFGDSVTPLACFSAYAPPACEVADWAGECASHCTYVERPVLVMDMPGTSCYHTIVSCRAPRCGR